MSNAERWTSRVLQIGGLLAVAVMTVGLIGAALGHVHGGETIRSLAQLRAALAQRPIDPRAISVIGFFLLCVTPFVAVITAGVAFHLEGDRRFTLISAIVATLLLIGLWFGGA
jgi:uncharacterized membrane protein